MQVINTTPLTIHVSTPPALSDPSTRRLLVTAKATFDLDPDGTPRLDTQSPDPHQRDRGPALPGLRSPPRSRNSGL